MVRKSKGFRSRSRKKLAQKVKYRPPITKFLQEFALGQKVAINHEPSSQAGMPHPRYKGKIGEIIGKIGKSYILKIKNGKKIKRIIVKPEHLKVIKCK